MIAPTGPGSYIYVPTEPEFGAVALRVEVVLREGVLMVKLPDDGEEIRFLPIANLVGRR